LWQVLAFLSPPFGVAFQHHKIAGIDVNYFLKWMGLAALVFSATGCISTKSYVEPQYKKATYESIERLAVPLNVKIKACR
jgi:hypothetical protein